MSEDRVRILCMTGDCQRPAVGEGGDGVPRCDDHLMIYAAGPVTERKSSGWWWHRLIRRNL